MGSINSKVMKLKRNSGLFIMKSDPSMKYGDDDMDDPAIMRHPKTKALIKRSLLRNGIFTQEVDFHNITASDMEKIIDCFNIRNFECGVKLFERNDSPTDHLYIVRKGIFKCTSDQETLAIYREGDLMGEVGFFHDVGRCLTITADTADASSFCISKREFQLIVEKGRDLNNIKILNSLTEAQKYLLKDGMSVSNYLRGETILSEGQPINAFYILLSGLVRVINTTYKENTYYNDDFCMYPGSYFGEENFLLNYAVSTRTFIALKNVTLCTMNKELFNNPGIFKSAVDQIKIDVSLRLRGNELIQNSKLNLPKTSHHPSYSNEISCLKKLDSNGTTKNPKRMKKRRVLWKKGSDDSDNEDDLHGNSISMALPNCACGIFPSY